MGEIYGRETELERVAAVSDHALVLSGEPGIGKTTLWEAGIAAARERGVRVLIARPSGAETELSFAGLIDLCEGLEVDMLPEPQRDALEVAERLPLRLADGLPGRLHGDLRAHLRAPPFFFLTRRGPLGAGFASGSLLPFSATAGVGLAGAVRELRLGPAGRAAAKPRHSRRPCIRCPRAGLRKQVVLS